MDTTVTAEMTGGSATRLLFFLPDPKLFLVCSLSFLSLSFPFLLSLHICMDRAGADFPSTEMELR